MNKEYMDAFREARKTMGFTHTSAYVPNNRLPEFSLYVERLKAERMMEIVELSPQSGERQALARRNVTDVPHPMDVRALVERHPNQPALNRQAAQCIAALEASNSMLNVAKLEDDDEARVKYMSLGVAHNHMANVLWRELIHMASQVEPTRLMKERSDV